MHRKIRSIMRRATLEKPLNILTWATHERYEENLAKTGHNFYSLRKGKEWNTTFAPIPPNYFPITEIPPHVDFDLILCHTTDERLLDALKISKYLDIPIIRHTHTLPDVRYDLDQQHAGFLQFSSFVTDSFISSFNRAAWNCIGNNGWVIEHGIDTEFFKPSWTPRNPHALAVVNLWSQRDWCCFIEGTRIPTINGEFANIEDIEEEDQLYSDNIRFINKLYKRKYSGDLLEINFGYNNIHKVTPEHPFIIKGKTVLAKDLKIGDSVQFSFPKKPDNIKLSSYLSEFSFSISENRIKCKGNNSTLGTFDNILVTSEFLTFVGWYLAEGSITKRNIEFDLHSEELDIAEFLLSYAKTIGINGFIKKNTKGNSIRVIFTSKPLASYLKDTFGDCSGNKKIPAEFMSRECSPLFIALLKGDGTSDTRRIKFDSKSRNLVESVFMFFAQYGICGHLSDRTREGFGVESKLYTVTYYGERKELIHNIICELSPAKSGLEIQNIKIYQVNNIDVYNFNVSHDNLYMTLYGLTHNCGYNLWREIISGGDIIYRVVGDDPPYSFPASSTEELREEYRNALVFVNTSLHSPVPTVLLEAMACGCAIVSTETCMIPEIIENGENGFLSNDPDELRDAIKYLISHPEDAIKMGEAARQTVVERFNLPRFIKDWDSLFFRTIENYENLHLKASV